MALEGRAIKFPRKLAATEDLIKECLDMEVKPTAAGNLTYGAWRSGSNDDLLLALGLAMSLAGQEYGARAQIRLAAAKDLAREVEYALDERTNCISPF
jgi:hypothetical protein